VTPTRSSGCTRGDWTLPDPDADAELRGGAGFIDGLAGMGEVAVEGIVGMATGKRDGFTPEQPRSVLTTTPSSLAGWAITHLRPVF
jgi:hypothetical protein